MWNSFTLIDTTYTVHTTKRTITQALDLQEELKLFGVISLGFLLNGWQMVLLFPHLYLILDYVVEL